MIVTQVEDTILITKQTWRLRLRALWFLVKYTPGVLPLVITYAVKNKANPGDIAVLAVTEAILPELQKELKERGERD